MTNTHPKDTRSTLAVMTAPSSFGPLVRRREQEEAARLGRAPETPMADPADDGRLTGP